MHKTKYLLYKQESTHILKYTLSHTHICTHTLPHTCTHTLPLTRIERVISLPPKKIKLIYNSNNDAIFHFFDVLLGIAVCWFYLDSLSPPTGHDGFSFFFFLAGRCPRTNLIKLAANLTHQYECFNNILMTFKQL